MNASHFFKFALVVLVLTTAACATPKPQAVDFANDDIPDSATDAQRDLRALKGVRQAQAAMVAGKPSEAIAHYKQALAIYRELDDFAAQGAIHNDLALMVNAAGKGKRALELLDDAHALALKGSEPAVVVEALYNMGVVLQNQ